MEQRVNVQLVEQHPHYYQGATISEIEDSEATKASEAATLEAIRAKEQSIASYNSGIETASIEVTSASMASVAKIHPQAVQASPVLVLYDDQRHRLRQKALVDSVESKV